MRKLSEEFISEVLEEIKSIIGDSGCVRHAKVNKNNGVVLNGITITMNNENVSPTAYIEYFVQEEKTVRDIAKDIITTLAHSRINMPNTVK